MTEHEKKSPSRTPDVEKTSSKRKSVAPAMVKLKAQAGEPNLCATILEQPMCEPSLEEHVALLGDDRASHPANAGQMARIVTGLQQSYGNAYVQQVIGRIQAKRDEQALREEPQNASTFMNEKDTESLMGGGQPLDPVTRNSAEASFDKDFQSVRVHAGDSANQVTQKLGVKAFTMGDHIFFQEGAYNPKTSTGTNLLGHELTHVVEHSRQGRISFWGGAIHKEITREFATPIFDESVVSKLEKASVKMDLRVRRLAGAAVPFLPAVVGLGAGAVIGGALGGPLGAVVGGIGGAAVGALATPLGFTKFPAEGPEHGEGGDYKMGLEAAAGVNEPVQDERLIRAVEGYKRWKEMPSADRGDIPNIVLENLGDALHIAQDRGAHWEGAAGMGHDDKRHKHMFFGWSPDDKKDNSPGYDKARINTQAVLKRFKVEALATVQRQATAATAADSKVAEAKKPAYKIKHKPDFKESLDGVMLSTDLKTKLETLCNSLINDGMVTGNITFNQGVRSRKVAHKWHTAWMIRNGNVTLAKLKALKEGQDGDGNIWWKEEWGKLKDEEALEKAKAHASTIWSGAYAAEGYVRGDPKRKPCECTKGVTNHATGYAMDASIPWKGDAWSTDANDRVNKAGLKRPVSNEAWHFELK